MKMAKASEADLSMAMKLANYLDAIERGQMPDELSEDEEAIEWLDERDTDQYAKLLDGLRRLLNQGSISRVIWGMAVICDPANEIIDPDADTLESHPRLDAAANDAERYRWLRDTAYHATAGPNGKMVWCVTGEGCSTEEPIHGEALDTAIDATLKTQNV